MSLRNAKPLNDQQVSEMWTLFGTPPVLSSEDKEAYDKIQRGIVAYYRPTELMVLCLIRELVDTEWEIFRIVRHRTEAIERRFRIRRNSWVSDRERKNDERKERLKGLESLTNAQRQVIYQLEQTIKKSDAAIKELATCPATAAQHNAEIEAAAKFLEALDRWQNTATVRRNNILKLLEYYSGPADQRAEVTKVECKEVQAEEVKQIAAPPVAPAELATDDVAAQNHSE